MLGDLNVGSDPWLDRSSQSDTHNDGASELQRWMSALNLCDAWRTTFPTSRVFSGPQRRNRIDYCLMSQALFESNLRQVRYVTDRRWHHEDHLPIEFRLESFAYPTQSRLPWRCPPWLLRVPWVQEVLGDSLDSLIHAIRTGPGTNPGCFLDKHKRKDCIFLRETFHSLKNADQAQAKYYVSQAVIAEQQYRLDPSGKNKTAMDSA